MIIVASVNFSFTFSLMIYCVKVYRSFLLKMNFLHVDKRIEGVEITSILDRLESFRVYDRLQILPQVQIRSHLLSFIRGSEVTQELDSDLIRILRIANQSRVVLQSWPEGALELFRVLFLNFSL